MSGPKREKKLLTSYLLNQIPTLISGFKAERAQLLSNPIKFLNPIESLFLNAIKYIRKLCMLTKEWVIYEVDKEARRQM